MLKTVLFIGLIGSSLQACLSEADLKKMGYTNVKTSPEKIEDSSVCKTLFKDFGACVDVAEVEQRLKDEQ